MQAKLVAMNGPLRKSEFPISGEISVGREAENTIRLEDPWVSARHCTIAEQNGRFILQDLESHAGTFVNGIPVMQRELTGGDEVAIGNSLFLFQLEKSLDLPRNEVRMDREEAPHAVTAELHTEAMENLSPEALAALPPPERMGRNLNALLRISRAIGSLRDEESLPWQLLGMIFDVIPAERGAMLLLEEDAKEVRSQVAWDRLGGPDSPVHISQALVRRVVETRTPLWNCGEPRRRSEAERTRPAFLCVPMVAEKRVIGILYLESGSGGAVFTQQDLELLASIAGLGVIGIENARQFERLSNEYQRLRAEVSLTHDMVGRSAKMRDVYQIVERVAASDSTVLICGESGTGKELAARAIHKNSGRKDQAFVALNCAALTETLLESEDRKSTRL